MHETEHIANRKVAQQTLSAFMEMHLATARPPAAFGGGNDIRRNS